MPGNINDVEQTLKSQTALREREVVAVSRQVAAHAEAHGWPLADVADVRAILGLD